MVSKIRHTIEQRQLAKRPPLEENFLLSQTIPFPKEFHVLS